MAAIFLQPQCVKLKSRNLIRLEYPVQLSNRFDIQIVQSMAVILSRSLQNLKTTWQPSNTLWSSEIWDWDTPGEMCYTVHTIPDLPRKLPYDNSLEMKKGRKK